MIFQRKAKSQGYEEWMMEQKKLEYFLKKKYGRKTTGYEWERRSNKELNMSAV